MTKLHILATAGALLLAATGASFAANPDGLVQDPNTGSSMSNSGAYGNGAYIGQPRVYNRGY